MEVLDVTQIEPRFKHPAIFDMFDALPEQGSFIIHNDHDPIPLYYQMLAERGQVFEWDYLERGPEEFKVRITKLPTGTKSKTIGELVASDYRKAEIFKRFGLDYCCGGSKTVKEACADKGLDSAVVESAMEDMERQSNTIIDSPAEWELDNLVDHIIEKHHTYVRESVPLLNELVAKVTRVHGAGHPELYALTENYATAVEELLAHMPKEENILFPYIKLLVNAVKGLDEYRLPSFVTIENPVRVMRAEHEVAGNAFEAITTLTNEFTPPAEACTSYKVLYAKLKEFRDDLYDHVHLENNILFPRAIDLEKELVK